MKKPSNLWQYQFKAKINLPGTFFRFSCHFVQFLKSPSSAFSSKISDLWSLQHKKFNLQVFEGPESTFSRIFSLFKPLKDPKRRFHGIFHISVLWGTRIDDLTEFLAFQVFEGPDSTVSRNFSLFKSLSVPHRWFFVIEGFEAPKFLTFIKFPSAVFFVFGDFTEFQDKNLMTGSRMFVFCIFT